MDLVVNHTSDQHEWFLESRSSKSNQKRDWYIWKPPRMDAEGKPGPPNNWSMILGEANSAWTYDSKTEEYYLANFTPEQPDLNWENPEVRAAVHDVMHFWLKRGVCGYRMDVINLISKVQTFPDAKPTLGPGHDFHPGVEYFINGPRMHEFLQELNREVLSKYDAITVGEMPGVNDIDEVLRSVGRSAGELNMIFIFDIVEIDYLVGSASLTLKPWKLQDIKNIVNKWQRAMIERDGWNAVFVENHDQPRSVTRYCDDSGAFREYGAKMLALMQVRSHNKIPCHH
jgi:oligo-1,6-glucosidase